VGTQEEGVKPAFYALRRGGWRDYVTLLHPPYTLWHLSYVALGAALAPHFHLDRLLWALGAFFLAMGVAAHALDELKDRPLRTAIPGPVLVALAAVSLAGAVAIGIGAARAWGFGLLVFIAIGAIAVPAYNLEVAFHTKLGFALLWGALPVLTGYFVEAQTLRLEAFAAAGFATATSLAQRTLSTPVRRARREHATTEGIAPLESSLRLLVWGLAALAVAVVAARLR
jgi:hypothetical protein